MDSNKIYELKLYPQYYKAIFSGEKTFELRKNDKDYQVGDILKIREWDGENFTGHSMMVRISYVQKGNGKYGLSEGFCVLGLKKR